VAYLNRVDDTRIHPELYLAPDKDGLGEFVQVIRIHPPNRQHNRFASLSSLAVRYVTGMIKMAMTMLSCGPAARLSCGARA